MHEERGVKNWCGMVKEILHKCGLESLWERNQVDGLSAKEFKSMVECCLYRLERMKWLQEIEGMEKLVLYRQIKQDFVGEAYVQNVANHSYRSVLARLRGGTLPLMLELGRYRRPKVPRTERICGSEVEDEIHFMLRCPALVNARRPILGECVKLCEDFLLHTHMEKILFCT